MYISYSVRNGRLESQRHNNPLNPRCFCLQRPKGMKNLTRAIVEVAKALGGSFKLVMPEPVREMTQPPRETQKDGETETN